MSFHRAVTSSVMFPLFLVQLLCFVSGDKYSNDIAVQLNDDVLGLIVFKSGVRDPFSHLSSWNEDDDTPCSWDHVECDPATSRVSGLALEGLGLSGRIGRGLQKLQRLRRLSLSGNNFTGDVARDRLELPTDSLEVLDLSRNGLSGQIPEGFVNASSIRDLDLSGNVLSGTVPESLFDGCSALNYVSLAGNSLEGPVPGSVAQCASLNTLNLSSNRFSGTINFVSGLWSLGRIRTLDLSGNLLSGPVPRGMSALHYIKYFSVRGNQFYGEIPSDVGLCPHLAVADFAENRFSGELPESLRRLGSLARLSSADNLLTGDLPRWIGEMGSVERLELSGNGFTGTLPETIGGMKSLGFLSLSNNKLAGAIPSSLGDCSRLSVVRLNGNGFNGTIPESLFDLALEEADFSGNQISGPIPAGSSKLFESLRRLDLSRNGIEGAIPPETALFSNLEYLNLSWNNLHSRIAPEFGLLRNLSVLDLRKSGFFGQIPGDICDSGSLNVLQLDDNELSGVIPSEIGNCSSLSLLSLSRNNLSGSIPKSISNITKLKILRLEFNQLIGEIPMELGKLQYLLAVNVSYNRLIGRLPSGPVFQSLDQSSLQGNLGICSPLLRGPCKLNVPKPLVLDPNAYPAQPGDRRRRPGRDEPSPLEAKSSSRHRMFLSVSALIAISAATLIVIGVLVVSLLNVSARKRLAFIEEALESMCSSSSRSGAGPAVGKLVLFDHPRPSQGLENPAEFLNKASEIGEGVFGTVYKLAVGQDQDLAMKKLITSNIIQNPEDFDREVRNLAKAKHPNLVSLKGYYWTPQVQLLVTEYASNGSLQSKLHERAPSSQPLPWAVRFKIMLGTAKGLAHLHHSVQPPIVHYNLKPSNVLLDRNMNPKISDFGLARLLTKLDRHVMSNRFQSALGYVAPELACQSLRVNEKCDVYGFGVLVLELVTGRRPVEYGEDNVVILSDHARVLLEEGNALECVDPGMGDYPEDEVLPVLKLALVCTSQVPSTRPSMAEVVQILQVIKTPLPQRMEIMF